MTVGKHVLGTSRTTHMGNIWDSQEKAPEYTRQTQWQSTQAHKVTIAIYPNEAIRDTARALKN